MSMFTPADPVQDGPSLAESLADPAKFGALMADRDRHQQSVIEELQRQVRDLTAGQADHEARIVALE